jgi:CRP-like cAMP-binding protein
LVGKPFKPEAVRLAQRPAAGAAKPAPSGTDGRTSYGVGDVLFNQGDAGGDLFFIEAGNVEIYTQKEGETIILSEMAPGEIIGVMTCLTSEPRMASARAKTPVVCKRVPHASIKKVLDALPNWMKIVLKEFTIRLTQMNKVYSEAVIKIKKLEQNQLSNVYTGAQLASAFAGIAEFMAQKVDDYKVVVVEDVMAKLEMVMNIKKEDLDRVFQVLLEAGLLKLEIEPDRKRTVTRLENAQKMAYFAQFVRESKHGPTKKLVRAKFTHKETRVLSAMVKLAARLDMDLEKNCKLSIPELERSLERATGVKFERGALDKGVALKLLAIEGNDAGETVVLKPAHLGKTVACVEAVRKLAALDLSAGAMAVDGAA